jgi:hypothetical protein
LRGLVRQKAEGQERTAASDTFSNLPGSKPFHDGGDEGAKHLEGALEAGLGVRHGQQPLFVETRRQQHPAIDAWDNSSIPA